MNRSFRLTKNEEIKLVRQQGQSFAHKAIVINTLPNQLNQNRAAVIAGRSVGGAVQRNLAKRRMRSALNSLSPELKQGIDLVLIARKPILFINYALLVSAVRGLLARASVLKDQDCE